MNAIAHAGYGPPDVVLEQRDVPEPAVADGGVVVRVRATSVNAADWHMIRGARTSRGRTWACARPSPWSRARTIVGVVDVQRVDAHEQDALVE
jgi:NADPH:quinone reductase-like Zn-dependent oxidoreductase